MNLSWFRPWLPFPSLSHKAHRKTKTPIKTLIHVYPETDCLETKDNAFKILFAFCHWPACHLHTGIIELIGKMAFVILSATNFISRQQKTSTSRDLAGGHLSSLCTPAKKHFVLCCWLSWSHFGELKKKISSPYCRKDAEKPIWENGNFVSPMTEAEDFKCTLNSVFLKGAKENINDWSN